MPDERSDEFRSAQSLSPRVLARIEADFAPDLRTEITARLLQYGGNEADRVQFDILELAAGDPAQVVELVERARQDYRDILFWAEYPEASRLDTPAKKAGASKLFKWLGVEPPPGLKDET